MFQLTPRKKAFLTGTLLLTFTGLICRILGFLPDLSLPDHWGGRSGTLSDGTPAFWHLLCALRRFPPDRTKPICGCSVNLRAKRLLWLPCPYL